MKYAVAPGASCTGAGAKFVNWRLPPLTTWVGSSVPEESRSWAEGYPSIGHGELEESRSAKVSSLVPAAPWDPTRLITRSRAAHAVPAAADDVVVEAIDVLDELPVDVVAPVVAVELFPLDEHAERAKAPSTAATTAAGRDKRDGRDGRDW